MVKFILFNLLSLGSLNVAYWYGWLDPIIATDELHISALICIVFVLGLVCSINSLLELSRFDAPEFVDAVRARPRHERKVFYDSLKICLVQDLSWTRQIASNLILLGVVGTILGLVVALTGIDLTKLGDANAIGPVFAKLIIGIAIALYSTFVGVVFNMWLSTNYKILQGVASLIYIRVVRDAED